jgi:serine/threonine protein phosphatase PrpC
MRPDDLPSAAAQAARMLGATGCRIYLLSRDQTCLIPLDDLEHSDESLSLEGSVAGWAFRNTQVRASGDDFSLWIPLLDGTERLGVLQLIGDDVDDVADLDRESVLGYAALVAELIVSKGQYTDSYERTRRAIPMGVAAEMLWRQLPPLTFGTDDFVVTAQLEPWHEVGGDAFDYSVDGDILRFGVFDAMGHGLGATLLASVALSAYRNARRAGLDLLDTSRSIDVVLGNQFGPESFVTGVLAELDMTTGRIRALSAAHPVPVLLRAGRSLGELTLEPGFPLGFGTRDDAVAEIALEPGDRLVLFSDGVVEARSVEGDFFGTERLVDLLVRQESYQLPLPETLRRLIAAVLEHQQGALQDDATVLMLEWRGDSAAVLPN